MMKKPTSKMNLDKKESKIEKISGINKELRWSQKMLKYKTMTRTTVIVNTRDIKR